MTSFQGGVLRWLSIVMLLGSVANAQEKSVKPGINDSFQSPDAKTFVERFEIESREVFAQREAIVAACQLKPGMVVADVGAGTGLFTRLFAKQVGPEGRVLAVDIAQNFLDHIQQTSRAADLLNVETVLCTADSTALEPETVDVAFICDTYHHFEFPIKTMTSLHRALKPGGRVIVVDFERIPGTSSDWTLGHVRASQEVFESEIVQSGFQKSREVTDLLKDNYFVEFTKSTTGGLKPLQYPVIAGYGGVVEVQSEELPQAGKLVLDITANAEPDKVNKGLERAARVLNLYGLSQQGGQIQITVVLHGEATKSVLSEEFYSQRFGVSGNPNLPLLEKLKAAGVEVTVCGQALNYKGFAESAVAQEVTIASSAITVLINRQLAGYVAVPVP